MPCARDFGQDLDAERYRALERPRLLRVVTHSANFQTGFELVNRNPLPLQAVDHPADPGRLGTHTEVVEWREGGRGDQARSGREHFIVVKDTVQGPRRRVAVVPGSDVLICKGFVDAPTPSGPGAATPAQCSPPGARNSALWVTKFRSQWVQSVRSSTASSAQETGIGCTLNSRALFGHLLTSTNLPRPFAKLPGLGG